MSEALMWTAAIARRSYPSASATSRGVLALVAAVALLWPDQLGSQQLDSVRSGVSRPAPATGAASATSAIVSARDTLGPPISPRRAFLYSLLLPGAGQARLDRHVAGGVFFAIEITALTLVHRSAEDLRIARAFSGDSMPRRYRIDATTGRALLDAMGAPVVESWSHPQYDQVWVRARRVHYEDWLAVMVFNHLFSGADAFVAAQLWDLPGKITLRQTPFGPLLQASLRFR